MDFMKNAGRAYVNTGFAHGGRRAGHGMNEDDYSETSFGGRARARDRGLVRFPNDDCDPEDLNGPVIIVQAGKKKE